MVVTIFMATLGAFTGGCLGWAGRVKGRTAWLSLLTGALIGALVGIVLVWA
jgi:hypothetical protein